MSLSRLLHSIFHPSFVGSAQYPTTKAYHTFAKCKFAFSNYKFQPEIYKFVFINLVQNQQVKYPTNFYSKQLPESDIQMAKLAKPVAEKKSVEKINEEAVVSSSGGLISGEDEAVSSLKGKGRGRKTKKEVIADVKLESGNNDVKSPAKNSEEGRGRKKQTNGVQKGPDLAEAQVAAAEVIIAALEKKPVAKGRAKKTQAVDADSEVAAADVLTKPPVEKKPAPKGRAKKVETPVAEASSAEFAIEPTVEKKPASKGRSKKVEAIVAESEATSGNLAIAITEAKKTKGRGKKADTVVAVAIAASTDMVTGQAGDKKPAAKGRGKKAEAVVEGASPGKVVKGKKVATKGRGKNAVASVPYKNEDEDVENSLPKVSAAEQGLKSAELGEVAIENGVDTVTAVAQTTKGRGRGKKNTAALSSPVEETPVEQIELEQLELVTKKRGQKKGIPIKVENQNGENIEVAVKEPKKRGTKAAKIQPAQLEVNGESEEPELDLKSSSSKINIVKEEPEEEKLTKPLENTATKSSKAKATTKRKLYSEEEVKVKPNEIEVKEEDKDEEDNPTSKKKSKKEPKGKKSKEIKPSAEASEASEVNVVAQLEKPKDIKSRSKKAKTPEIDTANLLENGVLEKEKKPQKGRKRAAAATVVTEDKDDVDGAKPAKAKKATGKLMNAIVTKYDQEDFKLSPGENGEERFNLKISSWNVAGLRSWLNKDGLRFLEYELPDIFCLQEIKCTTEQMPEEVARIPGYHPYWLCMPGGYAGVAIYSKIMPINVEYGIGNKEFDAHGRMITAEYEKFFLINVYVPNSGRKLVNLEARMRWEKLFQEYVKRLDAIKAVVICGDMNVSHQAIDLANPKTNTRSAGFTQEERDKMTELLGLGFVDTFRHLYPDRIAAYTYWTYMANARSRNVGWRLDYFIVSERFTKRIVDNCIRSQVMGSDHCPITLFLNM